MIRYLRYINNVDLQDIVLEIDQTYDDLIAILGEGHTLNLDGADQLRYVKENIEVKITGVFKQAKENIKKKKIALRYKLQMYSNISNKLHMDWCIKYFAEVHFINNF